MTKICKKSLALLLALAVCVSAMVCGVMVSAEETATPTITLVADKAAPVPGDTVTITAQVADFSAVFGADIEITLPAGLTVTPDETVAIGKDDEIYYNAEKNTLTYVGLGDSIEYAEDGSVASFDPVGVNADGTLFAFTFVVPEVAEVGTEYAFDFSATDPQYKAVRYCDAEENEIVPNTAGIAVTVGSAVVPCEHDWVADFDSEITPATGTADAGTTQQGSLTVKCAICGETKVESVDYYHYYACAYTNASCASAIQFKFNARENHLARQGAYESAFIKIVKEYATGEAPQVTVLDISKAKDATINGYDCHSWSIDIPAKELTDNITANVFVKYNGVWYSGMTSNKTVADYALSSLADTTGAVSPSEKKVFANMLKYGATMQTFKKYNLENMADANLGDYASYVTTTVPTIENKSSNPFDTSKSEVIFNKFNLEAAATVGLHIYFRNDYYTDGNLDDLQIACSYEASDGTQTKIFTDTEGGYSLLAGYTDRYDFVCDTLPAKYMRTMVSVVAYNGSATVSYTLETSIESLIAKRIAEGAGTDEVNVYYAMMNYGDACLENFGL